MKKNIKKLMHLSIEGTLRKPGRKILKKALEDPETHAYYERLKKADEIITRGFAWAKKNRDLIYELDAFFYEVDENIRIFEGKAKGNGGFSMN